jgi:predicted nuclease with TOPRIM domain
MTFSFLDAAESINALKEDVIPWRRKNAQIIAALKQEEIATDIKKKEAEALEITGRASTSFAERERLLAESEKVRAEAEQLRIANERSRFELQKSRLELAVDIVSKISPELSPHEKYAHAISLLPSLTALTESDLDPDHITPQRIRI